MDTRELWMELVSPAVLVSQMDYRGESNRSLAAKCFIPNPKNGRTKVLAPSVIGHLRSGLRTTCKPSTAKAIEKALGVAPGLLFTPRVARREVVAA